MDADLPGQGMEIDHSSMEERGQAIYSQGGELLDEVAPLQKELAALLPYFGSDEAARLFRRGAEGKPGFESALESMTEALTNMSESYQAIGSSVRQMSTNVRAADYASMADKNAAIRKLVEYSERTDDISTPTTSVKLD